jgi:hypothetical protein
MAHIYEVYVSEPLVEFKPIPDGAPTPELRDVFCTVEAESPEDAEAKAVASDGPGTQLWRATFGEDLPTDPMVRVTPGPDVCRQCEGRGRIRRPVPDGFIDLGRESDLDEVATQTCPECHGTGEANAGKRPEAR